ncbi:MAG: glycosyl hydrolase-related protein [Chloroflexota bacterium]
MALLNDCKYGYDVKDNVLRLTLIKSAVRPDALADKGYHRYTYSLLPHAGDWREGGVVREGYELNNGLIGDWGLEIGDWGLENGELETGDLGFSLVGVDVRHVVVSAVKEAEDGDGVIVRVYECEQRRRRDVTLTFGAPLAGIEACNLLEERVEDRTLQQEGNRATFALDPYEIKSFRVWFAGG